MVFNSFTFMAFLAAVLLLHHLPLRWSIKKFNLVWTSYLFYAAWNPPFVVLLWISTLVDWVIAAPLHRAASPLTDLGRWDEVVENLTRFAAGRTDFLNVVDLAREY